VLDQYVEKVIFQRYKMSYISRCNKLSFPKNNDEIDRMDEDDSEDLRRDYQTKPKQVY